MPDIPENLLQLTSTQNGLRPTAEGKSAGNKNSSCQVFSVGGIKVTPQTCIQLLTFQKRLLHPPTRSSKFLPIVGYEGSAGRGIALSFLNKGAKWGLVVNATLQPLYPWKETWYPLYGCWAGRRAGLVRHRDHLHCRHSKSYRSAHSESLYRLHYPGYPTFMVNDIVPITILFNNGED
jgi:hypothetical protein